MSAHTPGPWVACKNRAWRRVADIRSKAGQSIAFCSTLHEPDTRLIAAAPELLEALKCAIQFIPQEATIMHQMAQAAIAKATA